MKGVILVGGSGTRLYPVTLAVCKTLLPVYDKPMVYYPLSTLMLAGITEIMIITTPKDAARFVEILGDGSKLGISISYAVQNVPRGIADALIIADEFIGNDSVCLVLGDNIFFGHGLTDKLQFSRKDVEKHGGARVFGYYVSNPHNLGVVEINKRGEAISIEEKPAKPKSNYAIPGLYFYQPGVAEIAKGIQPSARGELEISSVNEHYLKLGKLRVTLLGRGFAWFDAGTHTSLQNASEFVMMTEERTGLKIGCIEETAFRMGYITPRQLKKLALPLLKSGYGDYLEKIAGEDWLTALQ